MLRNRNYRRTERSKAIQTGLRPLMEIFEKRELLTAAPFIQGTAFVDTVGNGIRTTTEQPLANATIKLYQGTTITPSALVANTTTATDGGYVFNNSNVNATSATPGLTVGQTYTLVESATGYTNTAASGFSEIDPYTVSQPNTIQVTVEPTTVSATYLSNSTPLNGATYTIQSTVPGSPVYSAAPTTLNTLNESVSNGSTVLNASFPTFCVDAGHTFNVSPYSYTSSTTTQSALPNGGQIAYLFNHYSAPSVTAASFPAAISSNTLTDLQAGVQVAIWDLEYNNGAATGTSAGGFNLTGPAGPTTATELSLIQTIATYLAKVDSVGKSEKVAVLDVSTNGSPSDPNSPHEGTQSVLAGQSFNFGNLPSNNSSIAGTVYNDGNGNDALNSGEAGIPGVTVTLFGANNAVVATTTSGSNGGYSFGNLAPGTYTVTETFPQGYTVEAGNPGSTGGTASTGSVGSIVLPVNTASTSNNLPQYKPASIAGTVYVDANANDALDSGDSGLAGITVSLTNASGTVVTTTSAANGTYAFTNLAPGSYSVQEGPTPAYNRENANPGISGGTPWWGAVTGINLASGVNDTGNNFGQYQNASIAGTVFVDNNANDALDSGDSGLAGITVTLTGTTGSGGSVKTTTTTATNGTYSFTNVAPGTYTVTETTPSGYVLETANSGTITGATPIDGSSGVGSIASVGLVSGNAGINYNFPQYLPVSISGNVYVDQAGTGAIAPGDAPIPGTTLTLMNAAGATVATTTTAANGTYSFTTTTAGQPLAPGTYKITETQPAGYLQGSNTVGTVNGTTDGTLVPTDMIGSIVLTSGQSSVSNNFGELGSLISGTVYVDATGVGLTTANVPPAGSGDTPEAGVTVTLYNSTGNFVATTTTASNGTYSFAGLPLGTYGIVETVPAAQYQTGPNSLTYVVTTTPTSPTSPGNNFSNYLACNMKGLTIINYVVTTPGGVSTTVSNLRGNTAQGDTVTANFSIAPGSTPVQLSLVAYEAPTPYYSPSNAYLQVITSVATGTYGPGTYSQTVTLPNSDYQVDFVCGAALPQLELGGSRVDYQYENRLDSADNGGTQAYALSSLAGTVYLDANGNDTFGTGDTGLAGVTVTLTGTTLTGVPVAAVSTTTSSTGAYAFGGLAPGVYTLTETQPSGYTAETSNAGTVGGTVSVGVTSVIGLNSNINAVGYNFGEVGSTISGTVYNDATGNGLSSTGSPLTGDTPEAGVTLKLVAANGSLVATTTTAANGTYSFTGQPFGNYTITEVVPSGQIETGPNALINTALTSPTSPNDAGNNFSNYTACITSAIQNITYRVNGCGPYSDLAGHVSTGSTVTATFTVTGSANQMLTLVSYVVPYAGAPLSAQVVYAEDTGFFTPGTHTVSVVVPNGSFQVDFVCGAAITQFGPSGSNVTYHTENRFFSSDSGGCNTAAYCPPPLANVQSDVGTVGTPGTEVYKNGTYTITGSGADIWGTSDGFNYVYQTLNGDGEIVARVDSISGSDPWTKAGVMIRQSLDPGSPQASVFATTGNGVAFQDRETQGGQSYNSAASNNYGCNSSTPVYVKLVRSGNTISGYDSSNGLNWTFIGSDTINMSQQVYVGLAVTSHNNSTVASGTFDQVNTNGYWSSCGGQSLIQSCGGWTGSTNLSSFLSQCYPNLYGSGAGCDNLAGENNNGIASFCLSLEAQYGAESLEVQTLAAALEEYFTCWGGGGQWGQQSGFNVTNYGFCSNVISTGCNSDAFSGCGSLYVWQMLSDVNNQSWGGLLCNGSSAHHQQATWVVCQSISCGY